MCCPMCNSENVESREIIEENEHYQYYYTCIDCGWSGDDSELWECE